MVVAGHLRVGVIPGVFWFDGVDKVVHVGVSTILTTLLWLACSAAAPAARVALAAGCPLGLSALNELTQPLAGRSCDGLDWLADAVGVCLGLTLCAIGAAARRARGSARRAESTKETAAKGG